MIDLHADGAGVDGAGFAGVIPLPFEFGGEARAEESEGVEVAFEVSVLAETRSRSGLEAGVSITAAEPPFAFLAFGVIGSSF